MNRYYFRSIFSIVAVIAICFWGKAQSAKSDSLFAKGVELHQMGKYKDAIPLFAESNRLDKAELDSASNRRDYAAMWLANCYYLLGDTARAKEEYEFYRLPPVDRRLTEISDSLEAVGVKLYQDGNLDEARKYIQQCADIEKKQLGENSFFYGNSLRNYARICFALNDSTSAIEYLLKSEPVLAVYFGADSMKYALLLSEIGWTYQRFQFEDNRLKACRYLLKADSIAVKLDNYDATEIETSISNLSFGIGYDLVGAGQYDGAILYLEQAYKYALKVQDKYGAEFPVGILDLLGFSYSSMGNYKEAVRIAIDALQIRERVLGKEHPDYASSLNNLASYNSYLGNYGEAVRLGTEALQIRERVLGKEHPYYATSLNNLASYNSYLGNYGEAVRLGTEALQIRERVLGKEHPDYARSLNNLASYNSNLGNYGEAVRLGTEALQIRERVLGKVHPVYATALSNLANYNSNLGNYGEAVRLDAEALQIRERVLGKEHPDYARSLNNLANYNSNLGNYSEALRLGTEALQIWERVLGKEHPDYATSLNNLANYNSYLGNYGEAVRLWTEALQIRERVLGKEHPNYVYNLLFLAMTEVKSKGHKGDISTNYYSRWFSSLVRMLRSQFSTLTESERAIFFGDYEKPLAEYVHRWAYLYDNDTIKEIGFDATLLSKGILLNTSQEMRQLIMNSNDSKMLSVYDEFKTNKLMLDRLLEKPLNERHLSVDSLERVVNSLERELISNSKEFGDYTRNMQINWRDVQSKMGATDVCVEFVSFAIGADSIIYAAYVLKKDMNCPVFVKLFEQKQLQSLPKKDYYSSSDVASLVWKPIAEYMRGASCVYFAPAGELYNIAIENIPCWDGANLMSETWNLYRLSSTRQLAMTRDKKAMNQARIYGGIQYNTGDEVLIADSKKRSRNRSMDDECFSLADSLNLRAGVALLPATKEEAMQIEATLKDVKITTVLRTDTLATEGDFKDMSASEVNLIHIATHGFYWTEREASKYDDKLSFLMTAAERPHYVEDKAMTRSGLLFAGANYALAGNKLPEGVDDGILTAREISRMNLRNVDMVVLSACQTGLGDLKGDGVFGLQRGLKKAGVSTIMMSLWKVDDKATELLMEQFYKNLASGMNKFESLKQSQKYLREYEVEVDASQEGRKQWNANSRQQANAAAEDKSLHKIIRPYNSPRYWAAFILLDADLFLP